MQPPNKLLHGFFVALTFANLSHAAARGGVVYVNAAAVGTNNGTSWSDAFLDLQTALLTANSGDQIWVAAGMYTPTSVSGDVRATFRLKNGVAIYGGFAGNETDLTMRDPATRRTILSGDIDHDDASNVANNSFHVVTASCTAAPASCTNATAVLDGFVVQAGDAHRAFPDDEGGGMYIAGGSPTIRNCTFSDNQAFTGAGMFSAGGQPTLTNCAFVDNFAFAAGGGLHSIDGNPTLTGTRFQGNMAGAFGGGLYHVGQGAPNLVGCSFMDNAANTRGGGIYMGGSGEPVLAQCEFVGNRADEGGGLFNLNAPSVLHECLFSQNVANSSGGGISLVSSELRLERCRFDQNSASDGGGVACLDGDPTVTDCTFEENLADATGGAIIGLDCGMSIRGSQFQGNRSADGGAVYNLSGHPTIHDCVFHGNTAELSGGAISNDASDAVMVGTTLTDNIVLSISGDGGAIWNLSSDALVEHCVFRGNAAGRGGGMSNLASSPTVSNTLFSGNSASFGGAMFNDTSAPTVANVTMTGNQAGIGGGIASFNATQLTLTNGILWGNRDSTGFIRLAQLYAENSPFSVNHTCMEGLAGTLGGVGNMALDPLFVDADGDDDVPGTADDNLQLSPGSPCNDAGDNSAVTLDAADLDGDGDVNEATPFSLEDHPRFLDDPLTIDRGRGTPPIVDMGAFEHRSPVRFVKRDATGTANGSNWIDAYANLQDALTEARGSNGVVTSIWVAAGTYQPAPPAGERRSTFRLPDGVAVYGGFAGGETRLNQRSVGENRSVLTGDLNGDDVSGFGNTSENAFHVVTADNVGVSTRLDGFVIRGGHANEVCNECFATGGGGLLLINSRLRLVDCTIEENQATVGGGIVINGGEPILRGCTILGNTATGSPSVGDVGGGGLVANGSSPFLVNCRLLGNSTLRDGGGLYVSGAGAPRLVNCTLSGNTAGSAGGGMLVLGGRPALSNCTLSSNRADRGGGGIGNFLSGSPTIANSILWDNEDRNRRDESAQILTTSPTVLLNFSCVQGWTGAFGGEGNIGADPRFKDATGADGQVGTEDDDLRLPSGSPCIDSGWNAAVAQDTADLDEDNNSLEVTPFDLDGLSRFADDPAVPDRGSDVPPVVDMGAFEFQPDGDCNNDEILDDDQVPQNGSVVASEWIGTSGVWNLSPINRNWCLPESPDNNGIVTFDVAIPGSDAVVTLNTSPTIASLTLGAGAQLVVNDASGANVRTLSVDGPIENRGVLRVTDRERLILDAPEINQHGSCGSGGVIEAMDGEAEEDETDDRSIVEINGSRILGGVVRALGPSSEIHLIGGAELVDSCAEGVVVPDGQTGRFSGTVLNDNVLRIDGVSDTTRLEPGIGNPVLAGGGCVRLTSQAFSRLGDFKNSFTNAPDHRIEGAGIVFGGLTNLGTVQADVPNEQLILFPPGQKRNDGEFRASDGGMLRIAVTIVGNGTYFADHGTILLGVAGEATSLSGSQLTAGGNCSHPGLVEVTEEATVELSGSVSVGLGGAVSLLGTSSLSSHDTVTFNGTDADCCCPCEPPCPNVAGGQTPPVLLRVKDSAQFSSFGSIFLSGMVDSSNSSSVPVSVGGNFDNRSECPQCFDWLDGTLRLNGSVTQTLEAAGNDFGPHLAGYTTNFALGRLEIAANARSELIDAFANQGDGAVLDSGSESLYVRTLVLEPGSRFAFERSRVYYCELVNMGGAMVGPDENLVRILSDSDCDLDVDLGDFTALSACLEGSPSPTCLERFDADHDLAIDLKDLRVFLNDLTAR